MSTRCSEFPFSFPLLDFSNFFPSIFLQILHQKISISLEYIIRVVFLSLKFRFTNVISVFYDIFNSMCTYFSKETFFEARKARINLGRPEMEKRKEKKRRREEKILVINVTRRSRSLDRESCWSELLPMLFGYLPIRWSHEAVTAESRTGKWEIGGRADRNHDGPSSINDPPPIHRSAITIFDVINPGSSLPCSQFCP